MKAWLVAPAGAPAGAAAGVGAAASGAGASASTAMGGFARPNVTVSSRDFFRAAFGSADAGGICSSPAASAAAGASADAAASACFFFFFFASAFFSFFAGVLPFFTGSCTASSAAGSATAAAGASAGGAADDAEDVRLVLGIMLGRSNLGRSILGRLGRPRVSITGFCAGGASADAGGVWPSLPAVAAAEGVSAGGVADDAVEVVGALLGMLGRSNLGRSILGRSGRPRAPITVGRLAGGASAGGFSPASDPLAACSSEDPSGFDG